MSWLTILAVLVLVPGVLIGIGYTVCQDNKHAVCVQYWKPAEAGVKVIIVSIHTNTQEFIGKSTDTLHKYYRTYMENDEDDTKLPPNKKTPEDSART
jgi:hypothetical protein